MWRGTVRASIGVEPLAGRTGQPAGRRPLIMGVVNATPDSFSDGGKFLDPEAAATEARRHVADGAAVVDIGGESTRPGSLSVPMEEELSRVIPVFERLCGLDAVTSIDTSKSAIAARAIELGAGMVNDVTALRGDSDMAGICAAAGVDVCLMHMSERPREMQRNARYEDVVSEVKAFLEERLSFAVAEGIAERRILLDPGIGFGKTLEHNVALIARLDEIAALGRPVLVGVSRKSFLGAITGREVTERLPATVAACVQAFERGASVLRVHDVAAARDALRVAHAICESNGRRP